ncbi:M13 family metallopeptidase [Thalassotalea agarivorans]|uniref:Putative endopeptidase n=1 Tax=Thalassotalea agarivorans TaxID=349064 RepID=A0A1H9YQ19_THASX|nr:M13-type metalloendopeptidase [Thalassotalea agarivorans]SES71184.1 putative endopeptidase [Thalassotalea agarivorans]
MKTLITGAVCTSLLLVAGCNSSSDVAEKPAMQKTALASGIDKANMDLSVRPQDNFYRYVNGGWINKHEIPADKTAIGSFYDLRDESEEAVKSIIEELAATPNLQQGSDEQKVADLFNSYMDKDAREAKGIEPIMPVLNEIAGLKSKDDLATFFGTYQAKGLGSPLAFYISIDAKESTRYATHIWQSGLGLSDRDYYFNEGERFETMRDGYKKHIANMYQLAGFKNGSQAADTVMAIETKLAEHHWTRVQTRDSEKRYNKFAVADLNTVTDKFNWTNYLTAQGVANQQDIIINQPDFVKAFGEIFADTSMTDWKTYLRFHALSSYASYLTKAIDDENFDFYGRQVSGRKEQREAWKRGVSVVNGSLGEVIGKVYVGRYFKPEAKTRMSVLVENLRNAYGESINDLEWMSEDTKKQAQIKLAAFTPKIGYPDKWQDYSGLEIKRGDLVGNIMRANQDAHNKQVAKLGGAIQKWEWLMTPQTVNAYYMPPANEIVFPAAILQPPFFNMAADDAVNYGGIGAVIGHEMGHGFDDQGSRYDAEGNLRNWWTDQDLEEFKKRTTQLVAQYDGYQVFDDLAVNGKLTLGENIGDLSGVTIAYKAYKASLNGKEAPVIDGLTGDQRFFMGFAQIWRSKIVEKSMRNRVETDPHSPAEFRALGSLSNMPEFYEAFDVKEGDKMYIAPENRVKIW